MKQFFAIFYESLMISGLVIVMMLILEYLHIRTRGQWFTKLQTSGFSQVLLGATLGAIPGCFGAYASVSLFTHHIIGLPALAASFIATYGDETFLLMSAHPAYGIFLSLLLFVLAILVGSIMLLIMKKNTQPIIHYQIHTNEHCCIVENQQASIIKNLRNISFERFLMLLSLVIFTIAMLYSATHHHHDHHSDDHHSNLFFFETWMQYVFIGATLITMFFIARVPDHFLREHLWEHIFKKHALKIFIWIFFTLLAVSILLHYTSLVYFVRQKDAYVWLALSAILIGFIPQSGPHFIFITLYLTNTIPFSILLMNSIVQEGHGGLPLIAESKTTFIFIKILKIALAVAAGMAGYLIGF